MPGGAGIPDPNDRCVGALRGGGGGAAFGASLRAGGGGASPGGFEDILLVEGGGGGSDDGVGGFADFGGGRGGCAFACFAPIPGGPGRDGFADICGAESCCFGSCLRAGSGGAVAGGLEDIFLLGGGGGGNDDGVGGFADFGGGRGGCVFACFTPIPGGPGRDDFADASGAESCCFGAEAYCTGVCLRAGGGGVRPRGLEESFLRGFFGSCLVFASGLMPMPGGKSEGRLAGGGGNPTCFAAFAFDSVFFAVGLEGCFLVDRPGGGLFLAVRPGGPCVFGGGPGIFGGGPGGIGAVFRSFNICFVLVKAGGSASFCLDTGSGDFAVPLAGPCAGVCCNVAFAVAFAFAFAGGGGGARFLGDEGFDESACTLAFAGMDGKGLAGSLCASPPLASNPLRTEERLVRSCFAFWLCVAASASLFCHCKICGAIDLSFHDKIQSPISMEALPGTNDTDSSVRSMGSTTGTIVLDEPNMLEDGLPINNMSLKR